MVAFGQDKITCYFAQRLLDLYTSDEAGLTCQDRLLLEAHLRRCPNCVKELQSSQSLIGLLRRYWPYEEQNKAFLERMNDPAERQEVIDEGWEDLKRRIPELGQAETRRKWLLLLRRVTTVAACLLIGVSVLFTFLFGSTTRPTQGPIAQQLAAVPQPSIRVEVLSAAGSVVIPEGTEIRTAGGELKTLIISRKHLLIMNSDTALSVRPVAQDHLSSCLVELSSGEILAHVRNDGNPFVVATPHGRAIITGTIFDVKTTVTATTLVVSKGNVHFQSEKGTVQVSAGHISNISGQAAPGTPVPCNPIELTAWATGRESRTPPMATITSGSDYDLTDLWLTGMSGLIDLESIDYDEWIEEKREWFKREFPWIFELKDALAKEGIDVDYPELLVKTDDVWQFVCLEVRPARFSIINPNSLLVTASGYGFDKQWLIRNVPAAKYAMEKPVLSKNSFTGLEAFERWLDYLDETKGLTPPTPIYSFHASKYLTETRSLIWFAVKDGKCDLIEEERVEVLALIQEEVTAARKCQNDVLCPEDKQKLSYDNRCQEPTDTVVEYVETIKTIEKSVSEYCFRQ